MNLFSLIICSAYFVASCSYGSERSGGGFHSEDVSYEEASDSEDFEYWADENIDLENFPDPCTFFDFIRSGVPETPVGFAIYWFEKYGKRITRYRAFNREEVSLDRDWLENYLKRKFSKLVI